MDGERDRETEDRGTIVAAKQAKERGSRAQYSIDTAVQALIELEPRFSGFGAVHSKALTWC